MASIKKILQPFNNKLKKLAFSTSIPLSVVLIPVEALIDKDFSCPCDDKQNGHITALIIAGPSVAIFCLMFLILTKCKCKCSEMLFKKLLLCLFPASVWVTLVFLDGDYYACLKTRWKGVYAYDDKLKLKWCKPLETNPATNHTELTLRSYTELQTLTLSFVAESQIIGFSLLLTLGAIYPLLYCINSCKSCPEWCPQRCQPCCIGCRKKLCPDKEKKKKKPTDEQSIPLRNKRFEPNVEFEGTFVCRRSESNSGSHEQEREIPSAV